MKSDAAVHVHLAELKPRSRFMANWERRRHGHARWFVEFTAEAVSPTSSHVAFVSSSELNRWGHSCIPSLV